MIWRVEIKLKDGLFDAAGEGVQKSIQDLGINTVSKVDVIHVYNLEGTLTEANIQKIGLELLTDPVTQHYSYTSNLKDIKIPQGNDFHVVEIAYNPGVMDPVEESTLKGIKDLGIKGVQALHTAKTYILHGRLREEELELVTSKVLSNKLIQHCVTDFSHDKTLVTHSHEVKFNLIEVSILKAKDKELMTLSQKGQLFLNLNEMRAIQNHFKKLDRNPTDCELETIAQTWSEHCYHKTFRSTIRYKYTENGKTKSKLISNLFKSTIVKATTEINKSWCVSVFHDNAGVIKFDDKDHVCFKVETHNHPSALEPFGGANTGMGGVIRDILGTGLSAKPICSTDVFCFAPPDMSFNELPPGTLHPKRVLKGVVSGVRDYGNKMGIPTVNGAVLFDRRFVGNPLVYCGNVGLLPKNKVYKKVSPKDLVVVVGGRTGRDGIHGATFSSGELTSDSEVVSSGAVQIGNPIQEKKVLDAILIARDKNLFSAVTDCGAGGLSSAVGEMGKDTGAKVNLDKVPLKYRGLNYTEIWISESQERMVLSVPNKHIHRLLEIFRLENVEATVIGEFTNTKRLELFYKDQLVCNLSMDLLHDGPPNIVKEAIWKPVKTTEPRLPKSEDLTKKLLECLSHYNVCSKEWIIRQYDHEVQGGSVIKPLSGVHCDGPSDASVVRPKLNSKKGIAISNGINFRYGMIDPYWMAASCIDEAIRQIVCVGGDPQKIAILDNFCWGNPDKPDRLGSLVRCAEGCYKTAVGLKVPFISGKDSLYNEYTEGGKSIAIPGTILISALGIIDDVNKTVTMDFKSPGNLIYLVGDTKEELGGSIYLDTFGLLGQSVPTLDAKKSLKTFIALYESIKKGFVRSVHDCSEGGLAVSLTEMAFAGDLGAKISLDKVRYQGKTKRDDSILFSESNGRFVVEVDPKNQKRFETSLKGISLGLIGEVQEDKNLSVYGLNKEKCIYASVEQLKETWKSPLNF
jgi:phosphoribosylformylglycinamidine synthase II